MTNTPETPKQPVLVTHNIVCPECGGKKTYRAKVCVNCVVKTKPAPPTPAATGSQEDLLRRRNGALLNDIKDLQRIIKSLESRAGVEELISQAVVDAVEANPYMPAFQPSPPQSNKSSDHEMLLLVSDAHYPEVVNPEECYGQEFGPEICRRRMQQLRDAVRSYIARRDYAVRKLTIGVIGDMLSGDIHEELTVTNATPIAEALVDMSHMLFELGSDLAEVLPVRMVVMPGNHPRTTRKPTAKYKWNNYEFLMGHMVKALARERFDVIVPKDLVYRYEVFERFVGLTHGDGIKVQSFAGIPHYSLQRRRNALQQLLRETGNPQLDLLCYGHFHQMIYDDLAGFLINGSIKGVDEFGATTRYAFARPTQALVTFHKRHFITDVSRIVLE